ncbi:MAG: formylglycine-generating enzyme family protein, partial [Candidatus Alcyoniella australis]|nr:formylglycine-generating enzyme family protein [Candidatus Alcyoniella australis]
MRVRRLHSAVVILFLVCSVVFILSCSDKTLGQASPPAVMVLIPGGTFQMGCSPGDSECDGDEKPRHQVTVSTFYMDVYEVTQADYQRAMGNNPSKFSGCSNCPVEKVSWNDAKTYCERVGKRLPTEAEWECAARGGTTGVRYGSVDSVGWYFDNSDFKTHPVGQKQANAYGLYDMLGNAWEWTADWYGEKYYSSSPSRDPKGPSSGSYRVLRGGAWN